MTVGIIGSLLIYSIFPFLMEDSTFKILIYLPMLVPFYIAYKISAPLGQSVAKKQWLRINKGLTNRNYDPRNPGKFYLVEKKWTGFWLYLSLYLIIEILPVIFRTGATMNPVYIFFPFGGFILTLLWAYYILKNKPN